MAYRDYQAPGVTVIVERQPAQETVELSQFYPVFVGTGMTSRSRTLEFDGVSADTTAFPVVKFTVDFSNSISSNLFSDTTFSLQSLIIQKTIAPDPGPTATLIKGTDFTIVSEITSVDTNGQGSFTVNVSRTGILATDLVYNFTLKAENTDDDFEPRLVMMEDQFYASEIFGPYKLTEGADSFFNDMALAGEIAFRTRVPAFYYVEVPRAYGAAPTVSDWKVALEKIYYKRHGYRIVVLTDDPEVTAAAKALVESMSNPIDKRESVTFVTYPVAQIANMNDIEELVTEVGGFSNTLNSMRASNIFCGSSVELDVVTEVFDLKPYYMAVAIACLDASLGMAVPLSQRPVQVFKKINCPKFRPRVWNKLAAKGVWIVTQEDPTEPIIIRHQLTSSQSDAPEEQEYSLVKNVDAITKLLRERLGPYAGKYNISGGYMEKISATLTSAIEEVKEQQLANDIKQLSPWSLRVVPGSGGAQDKRNLVTRLKPELAYPANNLDIYLLI